MLRIKGSLFKLMGFGICHDPWAVCFGTKSFNVPMRQKVKSFVECKLVTTYSSLTFGGEVTGANNSLI